MGPQRPRRAALLALVPLLLVAAGLVRPAGAETARSELSALARRGHAIFHDTSLSSSGRMACASCHDASRAFAGADALAVPLGGPPLATPGLRNLPSLKYLAWNPAFSSDAEGTPVGGMDRDGRATGFADQARGPLLAP